MAKTREIKGRMKAVGNIQRITKTMQMIATARFQAMQRRALRSQAYSRKIAEVISELAASISGDREVNHPLLLPPETAVGRELLLVITSNRGLAGAYNANILREASRFLRSRTGSIDLEVVGKKGLGYFRFSGRPVSKAHTEFGDAPRYEDVERLAQRYMDEFERGEYDAVRVVYMAFESMSRQAPEVMTLLPMDPEVAAAGGEEARTGRTSDTSEHLTKAVGADALATRFERRGGDQSLAHQAGSAQYEFSPEPQILLRELLPMTVKTRLFQAFNEAVVSEQLARMVAMKAATDAAGKMRKDLGRRFNRARQAAITTELSEIIAGAAALE